MSSEEVEVGKSLVFQLALGTAVGVG